jgi:catechol 2,3-dioxygenase-like lactoylglutathione lyase family enzyme
MSQTQKKGCSNVGIHHVGLYVKDPARSAEFYRDIFGMLVVGGTPSDTPGIRGQRFPVLPPRRGEPRDRPFFPTPVSSRCL